MLGIGTDIVKVARFKSWQNFSYDQLRRIFSDNELEDCKISNGYDLSKLAARFAAKEALFKALSNTLIKLNFTDNNFSFMFLCRNVKVVKKKWDVPTFEINWDVFEEKISKKLPKMSVDLSISHERDYAIAFVIVSN